MRLHLLPKAPHLVARHRGANFPVRSLGSDCAGLAPSSFWTYILSGELWRHRAFGFSSVRAHDRPRCVVRIGNCVRVSACASVRVRVCTGECVARYTRTPPPSPLLGPIAPPYVWSGLKFTRRGLVVCAARRSSGYAARHKPTGSGCPLSTN